MEALYRDPDIWACITLSLNLPSEIFYLTNAIYVQLKNIVCCAPPILAGFCYMEEERFSGTSSRKRAQTYAARRLNASSSSVATTNQPV